MSDRKFLHFSASQLLVNFIIKPFQDLSKRLHKNDIIFALLKLI